MLKRTLTPALLQSRVSEVFGSQRPDALVRQLRTQDYTWCLRHWPQTSALHPKEWRRLRCVAVDAKCMASVFQQLSIDRDNILDVLPFAIGGGILGGVLGGGGVFVGLGYLAAAYLALYQEKRSRAEYLRWSAVYGSLHDSVRSFHQRFNDASALNAQQLAACREEQAVIHAARWALVCSQPPVAVGMYAAARRAMRDWETEAQPEAQTEAQNRQHAQRNIREMNFLHGP